MWRQGAHAFPNGISSKVNEIATEVRSPLLRGCKRALLPLRHMDSPGTLPGTSTLGLC